MEKRLKMNAGREHIDKGNCERDQVIRSSGCGFIFKLRFLQPFFFSLIETKFNEIVNKFSIIIRGAAAAAKYKKKLPLETGPNGL